MPTIRSIYETDKVKVAAIFESGQVKPAWFQVAGGKPVEIDQICAVWHCNRGAAKMMTFEVLVGQEQFSLEYDTSALVWSLGRTVVE